MEVIDFYSGFEGEKEIRIYSNNVVLSIWDGYFSPIMEILLEVENNYKDSVFGIVAEWTTLTGWCGIDDRKTKIQNLNDEIKAFSKFDINILESKKYSYITDDWKKEINNVHKAILKLLKNAEKNNIDVYIWED